jgi:hypothetical protein
MSLYTRNLSVSPYPLITKRLFTAIYLALLCLSVQSQIAINTDGSDPHISAMLEIKANNLGFLPPRVTLLNRPANPATGLMIYQTDGTPGYYFFDGTGWQRFGSSVSDFWQPNANDIYFSSGKVSIGSVSAENNGLKVSNYLSGKAAVKGNVELIPNLYATGMLGVMGPALLGVPLSVMNVGVLGIKPNAGNNGAAIYGWNNDDNSSNYSGIFISDGVSSNNNYAIYAEAKGGAINYSGQFKGRILIEGNAGNANASDSLSTLLSAQVRHSQASDSKAIEGISLPKPGYGVGVFGSGGWKGLHGEANGNGYNGWVYGVQGTAVSGLNGTAVGVYGSASGGSVNWAGYFDGSCFIANGLKIKNTGESTYTLQVAGRILCDDIMLHFPDDAGIAISALDINNSEQRAFTTSQRAGFTDAGPSTPLKNGNDISLLELNVKLLMKIDALINSLEEQNKKINFLESELNKLTKSQQENAVPGSK